MISNQDVFEQSLVNHLYFANSIRSFCITIGLTFFKNNQDYIDRAIALGFRATDIINRAIILMNDVIAKAVLDNNVYITPYTKDLSLLTEKLFNIDLSIQIDENQKILNSRGKVYFNDETMKKIDLLNNDSLLLINDFKEFVSDIKGKIEKGELFSYLYLDFFNYMFDEISVYGRDIKRIQSKNDYTDFYLREYVYYFNELLRESSKFIRGFLDTKDQENFDKASYFVNSFAALTEKYLKTKDNPVNLNIETLKLVNEYHNYLINVIKELLETKTYFITPPITLDNFLTNVNVYLFILKYVRNI